MRSKIETRDIMSNFVMFVKNKFGNDIKIIRIDNGQEFCWKDIYDKHVIRAIV